MNYGMVIHTDPPDSTGYQKFEIFENPTAAILKLKKSRYLHNRLANVDEILHGDACLPSGPYRLFHNSKKY